MFIKKIIIPLKSIVGLIALVCMPMHLPLNAVTNKTFLLPRPLIDNPVLIQSSHQTLKSKPGKRRRFAFSAKTFYNNSTHSKRLARYFFPHNKTELSIDTNVTTNTDIVSTWLQIEGAEDSAHPGTALPFSSTIKIRPEHKSFGVILDTIKYSSCMPHLFFGLEIPIIQVENKLNLNEFNISNAAQTRSGIAQAYANAVLVQINATQALNNPLWRYGKITNNVQKLTGVADIGLTIGYDILHTSHHNFSLFAKAIIPFGYKPHGEYLFEPIIGNGRHFGLGFGVNGSAPLIKRNSYAIQVHALADFMHLFKSTELRIFDTISRGPWSRYMLVADPDATNAAGFFPAINYLSLKTRTKTDLTANLAATIASTYSWGSLEFGYNLWLASREHISLKESPKEVLFNAAHSINQPIVADGGGVINFDQPLTIHDINLDAATRESNITHTISCCSKIHGSLGATSFTFSLGSRYEFCKSNHALNQWSLWNGISFAI